MITDDTVHASYLPEILENISNKEKVVLECEESANQARDVFEHLDEFLVKGGPDFLHSPQVLEVGLQLGWDCSPDLLELEDFIM